jgi:hypothetical protein
MVQNMDFNLASMKGVEVDYETVTTCHDVDVDDITAEEVDQCAKCARESKYVGVQAKRPDGGKWTKGFEASSSADFPHPDGDFVCEKCLKGLTRKEKMALSRR